MNGKKVLALHLRAAGDLHRISPWLFPVIAMCALVTAVTPYATVWLSAQLLNELAALRRAAVLRRWAILAVVCLGLLALLKAGLQRWRDALQDDIWQRKELLFVQKMFALDYADMDKQQTHDLRAQIRQNENWANWGFMRVLTYFETIVTCFFGALSGVALTASLFAARVPEGSGGLTVLNNPLFILLLLGLMLLFSLLSGFLAGKATACWSSVSEEATLGNRLFSFFGFIGTKRSRDADMRMYNQQCLVKKYWAGNSAFGSEGSIGRLGAGPLGIYQGLSVAVSAVFTGFVYVFACLKAWAGAFGVGSVTQYVGAVTSLSANVSAFFALFGSMKSNAGYLETIYRFLDIPNAMSQGHRPLERLPAQKYEVEFKNVSFRYPGTERWALKNVSLKFKAGQRLAIVGENGSGKTTFIKLLCRLYDAQEGQILLNGVDIREYDYQSYISSFSVVFQDFQLLSQPLGANVAGSAQCNAARAKAALLDAGFGERLSSLPEGLDTLLYKDFAQSGVDVSGGEAQKIAIARALYRNAPFIILDEPTAALDPVAEAEIYSRFDDIVGDKTAVYISHRLSSCKFCDEIAVFDQGRLLQQGTHETLVADRAGKYYALWHAQAQYYTESGE